MFKNSLREALMTVDVERLKDIFRKHGHDPEKFINWNVIRVNNSIGRALKEIYSEGHNSELVYKFIDENSKIFPEQRFRRMMKMRPDLDKALDDMEHVRITYEGQVTEQKCREMADNLHRITARIARRWYQRHILKITPEP